MALEDDIARVAANPSLSPSAKSLVSEQLRANANVTADAFRRSSAAAHLGSPEIDTYRAAAGHALMEYRRTRERDAWGHALLDVNNHLVMGTIAVATIVSPPVGVAASLAMAGTQFAMERLTSSALDALDAHAKAAATDQLGRHLRKLRDDHGVDLAAMSGLSVEDARAKVLGGAAGVLAAPDFTGLEDDAKAVVREQLGQVLDDAIIHQLALNGMADAARDDTINQLVGAYRTVRDFQDHAKDRLAELDGAVQSLGDGLAALHARVADNTSDLRQQSEDVHFLKEIVFGQMSVSEQRDALKRGMFPDMPAERRKALQAKLDIVATREAIVSTAQTFLNGAGIVTNVAEGLGLDAKVVAKMRKAAALGQTALTTFTALASGNVLGAIGAVSGMIFGGGKDVAAQRHDQIMGALDALAKGQEAIMKTQDQLLEGQRNILENQRRIFEEIGNLSERVRVAHLEVMNSLRTLRDEVLVNRVLLADIVNEPADDFVAFLETRRDPAFDFENGRFRSYEGMRRHFEAFGYAFRRSAEALTLKIQQRRQTDPIFLLDTYARDGQTWNAEAREAFRAMGDLLASVCQDERIRATDVVALLLLPSATWRQAARKLSMLQGAPSHPPPARAEDFAFIAANIGAAVAPEQVLRIVHACIEGHLYFSLLDRLDAPSLPTVTSLASRTAASPNARVLLTHMSTIVDLAVAQCALSAGDVVLDAALRHVRAAVDAPASASATSARAMVALSKNPLFAANWIRHMVRAGLEESGTTTFSYDGALFAGAAAMKEVLPGGWDFVAIAPGTNGADTGSPSLALRLPNGTELRLPRGSVVHDAELHHAPEIEDLLVAKNQMLDALMEYRLLERVPPEIERALSHLAVLRPLHLA